jgi:hypothetical protein
MDADKPIGSMYFPVYIKQCEPVVVAEADWKRLVVIRGD